ncbi:MAG: enoyl-CoA hydratase/isomerase family protein [Ignavibacteriales bacterium]
MTKVSQVLYRKEGHIAYISLNNPERRNAINRSLVKELAGVWVDFRDDNDLWVAILSGEGQSFCSGADVKEMERGRWRLRESLIFGDDKVSSRNYGVWKPIVAAVHRHVFGAGLMLAMECDIKVASDDAIFGLPEGKVNIPTLLAPFLADYMPRALAAELVFTGKPIDAQRAYQAGMINKVVPREQLMAGAREYAEQICELGPLSLWATKELLYRTRYMDYESTVSFIEHVATPVWNSEDSVEGKRAFIEKRKPQWQVK